jgi:hypothetical protein
MSVLSLHEFFPYRYQLTSCPETGFLAIGMYRRPIKNPSKLLK